MGIYIVFVTVNYSLEGYKVDATRYLLKNTINFDELSVWTQFYINELHCIKKYFKFNECEKKMYRLIGYYI